MSDRTAKLQTGTRIHVTTDEGLYWPSDYFAADSLSRFSFSRVMFLLGLRHGTSHSDFGIR